MALSFLVAKVKKKKKEHMILSIEFRTESETRLDSFWVQLRIGVANTHTHTALMLPLNCPVPAVWLISHGTLAQMMPQNPS